MFHILDKSWQIRFRIFVIKNYFFALNTHHLLPVPDFIKRLDTELVVLPFTAIRIIVSFIIFLVLQIHILLYFFYTKNYFNLWSSFCKKLQSRDFIYPPDSTLERSKLFSDIKFTQYLWIYPEPSCNPVKKVILWKLFLNLLSFLIYNSFHTTQGFIIKHLFTHPHIFNFILDLSF